VVAADRSSGWLLLRRPLLKWHHVGIAHTGRRFLAFVGPSNKHLSTGNLAVRNDSLDYPRLVALVGDATAGLLVNERSTRLLKFSCASLASFAVRS
jgi:hypothetical protein